MAKPSSSPAAADTKGASEKAAKGSGLGPKLMIAGFVCAVIVAETALFFFAIPSADEVAKLAEARLIQNVQNSDIKLEEVEKKEDDSTQIEFKLGDFSVVCKPGGDQRTHRVEFKIFGTLKAKNKAKLEKLFKEMAGRFRHRLIMEIRTATYEELNEDQLALIQRRILAISNEVFGEPILLDIGFENYEIYEE
jgi:hypothetical protein